MKTIKKVADKLIAAADMVFTLDFNTLKRIDQMGVRVSESSAKKIMIDHHQEPDDYTDIMFSNPAIGSTCEFVFQIIEGLGLVENINKDIASSLYTGIVTDTGSFRISKCYLQLPIALWLRSLMRVQTTVRFTKKSRTMLGQTG
jgi:phosphoesterase RecJ-like protein